MNEFPVTNDGVYEASPTPPPGLDVTGTNPLIGETIDMAFDSLPASEGNDVYGTRFDDFTASGSTPLSYTVNWGDGTTSPESATPGEWTGVIDHLYPHAGNYEIEVSGNGDAGYSQATVSRTNPTIVTPGAQTAGEGDALTVTTTFSDVNSDPNAVAYVNWGDGTGWQMAQVSGDTITATLPATAPAGSYESQFEVYPLGRNPTVFDGDSIDCALTSDFAVTTAGTATGQVEEVDFSAQNPADFHPVTDDLSGISYSGLQWVHGNGTDESDPICYTRSDTANDSGGNALLTATANLNVSGFNAGTCKVYAIINGVATQAVNATLSAGNTVATATITAYTTAPIPSTVQSLNEAITWEVSNDGGAHWANAGATTNKMYVINGTTPHVGSLLQSVLDFSCRSASRKSSKVDIVNAVAAGFASLNVTDARGNPMYYWGPLTNVRLPDRSAAHNAAGLCKYDDGRCGAWAQFMVDALDVQGIDAQVVQILPKLVYVPSVSFNNYITPVPANSATFLVPHPAQNILSPQQEFGDHAVVELAGADAGLVSPTIFDPSYGKVWSGATIAAAELNWENGSVSQIKYYGVSNLIPIAVKLIGTTNPSSTCDFIFTPVNGLLLG